MILVRTDHPYLRVRRHSVRQGDSLSPMLFLLAMEPLLLLFRKAQEEGLLQKLCLKCDACRVSLYANDAALFMNPTKQEVDTTDFILSMFAEASGLVTNLHKTHYYPIQCNITDIQFLYSAGRNVSSFPFIHLGLPLHYKRPNKETLQPLIQKVANRLPSWQRCFFSYPGREILVKHVLSAIITHFLTIFKMAKWAICGVDRFRRCFF
jgi:hypothetical protein